MGTSETITRDDGTTIEIVSDLWICVDCLFFHANGDLPDDAAASAAVLAGTERETAAGGRWSLDGPRDGEAEGSDVNDFSWRACACCGSKLGGSRHRAAVVYTKGAT